MAFDILWRQGFPILRDFREKGKYAKNVQRILRMRQDSTWRTHKICFMNKHSSYLGQFLIKIIKIYKFSFFISERRQMGKNTISCYCLFKPPLHVSSSRITPTNGPDCSHLSHCNSGSWAKPLYSKCTTVYKGTLPVFQAVPTRM
jgi:hypothetical protein